MTNTDPAKPSKTYRYLMIFFGIIIALGGIAKMSKGFMTLRGANGDAQFKPLLEDVDKSVNAANKAVQDASPLFKQLLDDVDKNGLPSVRAQEKNVAEKVDGLFHEAAIEFYKAAKQSEAAASHHSNETMKKLLVTKAEGYTSIAKSHEINQEIVHDVLDPSITTVDALLPKITEAAERRDAAQKSGTDADARAEALAKDGK